MVATNDTQSLFYAAEITASHPGTATFTFTQGWGTTPRGTYSQFTDTVGAQTSQLLASDTGYRTSAADGDPISYPPILAEAFAIDRKVPLEPTSSSVSAAWGTLNLSNDNHRFDSVVANWNSDGQPVNILYGYRQMENFAGLRSTRTTLGTFIDSSGTLQTAPAFQTRRDYSAVIGNPGTTNQVRNPNCTGGTNGIIGGAGHAPTNWGSSGLGGVTVTLVGNGTDTGVTYAEYSFVGTPSSSGQYAFFFDSAVPANPGDLWTASYYAKLQSGTMANVVGGQFFVQINTQSQFISTGITPTATITRVWTNLTAATDTVTAQSFFAFSFTSGAALNFNVRIGSPSLQSGTGTPTILNEAAATNSVRNPRAEGSVVGTPGTMPTNYSITNAGGITSPVLSVIGTGTESGIPYIDVSFAGVLTAGGTGYIVNFEPVGIVAALTGQVWRGSLYYRLMSGSLPTGSVQIQATELTSGGSNVTTQAVTVANPNSLGLQQQRRSATLTLSGGATTAFIRPNLKFTFGANLGVAFAFTIRVGGIQYERGSTTTSLILPPVGAPAASTRSIEVNYPSRSIFLDPSYSTLGTLLKGIQAPWFLSEKALQIPIRDATYWLSKPVQSNQYLGSGTYQGTAALIGVPLPITRGGTASFPVCNVSAILIDPAFNIWQYTDAAGTIVHLYEGGSLTITAGADTTNLYAGTTGAGTYRTDNSRGLFQLAASPQGELTVDCTGQFPSAGVQTSLIQIVRYLLTEQLQVPAANVLASHYNAVAAAYAYTGGIHIAPTDTATGVDVINRLLTSIGGKMFPARDGTLRVSIFRDPSAVTSLMTGTAEFMFNTQNIISLTPQALPSTLDPPPYRMRVGFSKNYTVQTSGLLASTTAAHRQFVATADTYASASSSVVLANYSKPTDMPPLTGGALLNQAEAQVVANELILLWGVRRRLYNVVVPISLGITVDLCDLVQLTWPMDNLAGGQLGIIVAEQFRSSDATITFQVLV